MRVYSNLSLKTLYAYEISGKEILKSGYTASMYLSIKTMHRVKPIFVTYTENFGVVNHECVTMNIVYIVSIHHYF